MGIIVDIAIIAILIVLTVAGYKKGLIKSVMGLVAVIASVILAANFYSHPAQWIKADVVEPYFVDATSEVFTSLMNGGTETIAPDKIFEDRPNALEDIADKFGLDITAIQEFYENNIKQSSSALSVEDTADKLSEFVVEASVDTVSNVVGFILTFIAALIAITLILLLVNLIFRLPVLNFANRLTGAILGTVKGVLISVLILNVLVALTTATTDTPNTFFNYSELTASNAYNLASSYNLIFIGK